MENKEIAIPKDKRRKKKIKRAKILNVKKIRVRLRKINLLKLIFYYLIVVSFLFSPVVIKITSISPHEVYKYIYDVDLNAFNVMYDAKDLSYYVNENVYNKSGKIKIIKDGIFNTFKTNYTLIFDESEKIKLEKYFKENFKENKNMVYFKLTNKDVEYIDSRIYIKSTYEKIYKYNNVDFDYRYVFDFLIKESGYQDFLNKIIIYILVLFSIMLFAAYLALAFLMGIFEKYQNYTHITTRLKIIVFYSIFPSLVAFLISFLFFSAYLIVYLILSLYFIFKIFRAVNRRDKVSLRT